MLFEGEDNVYAKRMLNIDIHLDLNSRELGLL